MKHLLVLLAILVSTFTFAAVYVNKSPNGGIEYSDTPTANASKMDIPAVNSISTTSTPITDTVTTPTDASTTQVTASEATNNRLPDTAAISKNVPYKLFEIESPKDQETIQNQNVLAVVLKVDPPIQSGDNIQVYLDGKPVGVASASVYHELGVVDRGTHTMYAEIINNQKEAVKRTSTITIFVHRNSVLTNPAN